MPFSQFTNIKKIAVGGFSIVYQATLLDSNKTIILKRFKNTQYAEEYFLRELKSYHDSYADNEDYGNPMVIETYGFTKDPRLNGLDSYILVMEYASGGNLHEYLQKNFTRIGWQEKLDILFNIINGLQDSKKLGPKFSEKSHPKAIYTSRSLNSYISKCSSIFSKCSSIKFSSNDYISKELKFDIDAESNRLDSFVIKRNIEESNINSCENNVKRIKN
ncbi:unnamed protein product [Rhizophagus irregularis]|nr:unnamed protein product [Rhizophagus irregularis]CAB5357075.1 unnamed protein product [Rhizophagus irregularis]